ncbi:MAG: ABC transporter ATP-binding protein [Thermomicrobiales bacterium]|nr:ABC transporter ATP-binding protein [Thermomicrobiales bacterium]
MSAVVAAPPALAAEGITSGYSETPVVRDVSLAVARGEIVTIIGPNGAGKSTLLKTIFGFLRARTGRVRVDGADVTGLPPERLVRRGLAFVPQTDNIFASLSVRENLAMGGFTREDGVEARTEWVLQVFPVLADRLGERAGRLSGGQRQTLALARALMLEPSILLLDEPSASLSPVMVESVFANIVEINRRGTAVLMIEQNARQALAISHRGYVLTNGQNRLEGPAAELLASDEVRRLYLGE